LIKTVTVKDPLTEEALVARLDLMRAEVASPDPSPLEDLLAERVCSLWLLIESSCCSRRTRKATSRVGAREPS
jgi:hypothetical protein